MPTLILTPRHTDDTQVLWAAAARLGWSTERLGGWRVPDHLLGIEEPVLYVEALLGPFIAEQFGLLLPNPPEDWLVRLPTEYRLREVMLSTLGEARALDHPMFIKPPNDKSFSAGVYRGADLSESYAEETPVLIADVVEWEKEFRCFVLDREVQAFSLYARNGELQDGSDYCSTNDEDRELREFMERLLADDRVELPCAAVIDAGVMAGRGWGVVEQNAAWGAGIYGCDPERVLEVIRHATVRA